MVTVRIALTAVVALALVMSAGAARAGSVSTTNSAGATIVSPFGAGAEPTAIDLGNGAYINFGPGMSPPRSGSGMRVQPRGNLVAQGGGNPHLEASFSAAITLSGRPNQAFGVSLPGSTLLRTGGAEHSVRAFTHDAGETPALSIRGTRIFNIDGTFNLEQDDAENRVYLWTIDIIVSNN
jgi:hypothetical protein